MKRSKSLALTVMATSAFVLAACDDGDKAVEANAYPSVEACVAEGKYTEKYCADSFSEAKKEFEETAPRFADQKSCEEQFGAANCQPRTEASSGGSFWGPLFAGYMISNIVNDLGGRRSAPMYSGSGGGWRMADGTTYSRSSSSRVQVPQKTFSSSSSSKYSAQRSARTSVVSRGGFGGSSSRSGSSFGG